jgi:Leucine-rich repeat (LRR) protein
MSFSSTIPSQIQALELLFNSTKGEQWRWRNEVTDGPKWSFASPQADPCNDKNRVWQGIVCSSQPSVCKLQSCEIVSLTLSGYNLEGTLPSQLFFQLQSLTELKISASFELVGIIPSEIGFLSQLGGLSLDKNQLTGPLPSEICFLSQLSYLSLDNNQLTGPIPTEIGSLSQLSVIYLHSNQLTGAIPSEIGSISQLGILSLDNNPLAGAIPSEIGFLSQLGGLSLYNNQLTGSIPTEIGFLSQLGYLSLYNNQLTGPIPTEIGLLSQLDNLYLDKNLLTGDIPPEIGSISQLGVLYLSSNQLTGSIPSEIGFLSQLVVLYLESNRLTGAIPFEIGSLSLLGGIYLDNNQLTGPIPSEIGYLSQLGGIYLDNNHLTGVIPSSFSNLVKLVNIHLHRNHLEGPITFQLSSFPQLQQLFLHQNRFTGQLHLLFSSSISSSSNFSVLFSDLLNLDVSDNLFSGSIPSTLFLAPHLQSISLSLNCFEHELPSAICDAPGAEVLSMDGLGSAEGCKNVVTLPFPFTSVSLVRSVDGSIPDCVWSMSNLRTLNIAGNGLRGRIGSVSSMSSLLSLTLSHNHMSGKIPLWLQEKNMLHLDLSHNKLTGDADSFKHQDDLNRSSLNLRWQSVNQSLALGVNRLSGDIPSSFGNYADLDILAGNLFGCHHIPKNDEHSESLSCGSEQYDQGLVLMGGVLGMIVCLAAMSRLLCLLFSSSRSDDEDDQTKDDQRFILIRRHVSSDVLLRYARYYQSGLCHQISNPEGEINCPSPFSHSLKSTVSFGSLLSSLTWSACVLTTLCLLLSLPVYILKQLDVDSASQGGETQYITHTHMYNWLWTMAFVSGTTPAIILLVTGYVCLSYFNVFMSRLGGKEGPSQSDLLSPSLTDNQDRLTVWTVFLLNIAVVGTVNGLYIWSTLLDLASDVRLWIQLSFALFTFLWSVILRIGLPSRIKESGYGVWLFICLNAMNSVMIPCAVTALSTPSCYQVSLLLL